MDFQLLQKNSFPSQISQKMHRGSPFGSFLVSVFLYLQRPKVSSAALSRGGWKTEYASYPSKAASSPYTIHILTDQCLLGRNNTNYLVPDSSPASYPLLVWRSKLQTMWRKYIFTVIRLGSWFFCLCGARYMAMVRVDKFWWLTFCKGFRSCFSHWKQ